MNASPRIYFNPELGTTSTIKVLKGDVEYIRSDLVVQTADSKDESSSVDNKGLLSCVEFRVLRAMKEFRKVNGCMPTTRELQKACGFASQTSVMRAVTNMENKGVIKRSIRTSIRSARIQPGYE